jgi:hypothetical protein
MPILKLDSLRNEAVILLRHPVMSLARMALIFCMILGALALLQVPSKSGATTLIKQLDAELKLTVVEHYAASGITSNNVTITITNAGLNGQWAMYGVVPKAAALSDDAFTSFAHYTNGKWQLVNGTGALDSFCPTEMPSKICTQLEPPIKVASRLTNIKTDIKGIWFDIKSNYKGSAILGPIQWNASGGKFTLSGEGASAIVFTFQFGYQKNFVAQTLHRIEVFALTWGNSTPVLEVPPFMIVNVCFPGTTANMGTSLAAKETLKLRELNQLFLGGTFIETGNSKGILNNVVSSNNLLVCNGGVTY